jgi:rubrerythrin
MRWRSLDEVLRFAIRREADDAAFYRLASDRSKAGTKEAFLELAREEEGHRRKLEAIDLKKLDEIEIKEASGLGIGESIEEVQFDSEMTYGDLLRMAIKNEEKARQLYSATAQMVDDPSLKKLLLLLAQEEAAHKEKLEKRYDEDILTEF